MSNAKPEEMNFYETFDILNYYKKNRMLQWGEDQKSIAELEYPAAWWIAFASYGRMTTYVMGILIGQSVLHQKFTPKEQTVLRWLTDGLMIGVLFAWFLGGWLANGFQTDSTALEKGNPFGTPLYLGAEFYMGIIMLGITRSDSFFGKLFAWRPLVSFAQYSYALYALHPVVINWIEFVRKNNIETFGGLWSHDYSSDTCDLYWVHSALAMRLSNWFPARYCHNLAWDWVVMYALSILLAVVATLAIHKPAQRLINAKVAKMKQAARDKSLQEEEEAEEALLDKKENATDTEQKYHANGATANGDADDKAVAGEHNAAPPSDDECLDVADEMGDEAESLSSSSTGSGSGRSFARAASWIGADEVEAAVEIGKVGELKWSTELARQLREMEGIPGDDDEF